MALRRWIRCRHETVEDVDVDDDGPMYYYPPTKTTRCREEAKFIEAGVKPVCEHHSDATKGLRYPEPSDEDRWGQW